MTPLYNPSIASQITDYAQQYIVNFDINSLYSYSITPTTMIYVEESAVKFTKLNYHHFLRVNNRKRKHGLEELKAAGYSHVKTQWRWGDEKTDDYDSWIKDNCKPGSVVEYYNTFWFAYDSDALAFKMRWL